MAGEQNITGLPKKTVPAAGDQIMVLDQAEGYLIDYKQLAKAFLAELQTMEFSQLQTVAKNLLSAVNELNSKTKIINTNNLLIDVEKLPPQTLGLFFLLGDIYVGNDLPNRVYIYGIAIALKRHDTSLSVVLLPEGPSLLPIINHRSSSGVWNGWRDFAGNQV